MIALQIENTGSFMSKLLRSECFDLFLLEEAVIRKAATWKIDGHMNHAFLAAQREVLFAGGGVFASVEETVRHGQPVGRRNRERGSEDSREHRHLVSPASFCVASEKFQTSPARQASMTPTR